MTVDIVGETVAATERVWTALVSALVISTMYEVTGRPFPAAADHESVTWPTPAKAEPICGASGSPAGVLLDDTAEGGPPASASSLTAITRKTYATPLVRPVTIAVGSGVTSSA